MTTILIQVNFGLEKTAENCFLFEQLFVSITVFVYDTQRNAFQDKHICNSLLYKRRNSH